MVGGKETLHQKAPHTAQATRSATPGADTTPGPGPSETEDAVTHRASPLRAGNARAERWAGVCEMRLQVGNKVVKVWLEGVGTTPRVAATPGRAKPRQSRARSAR